MGTGVVRVHHSPDDGDGRRSWDPSAGISRRTSPALRIFARLSYFNFAIVIVMELALADGNWRDLVERVRYIDISIPIVLVTSSSTAELWWDALECGIADILPGNRLLLDCANSWKRNSHHEIKPGGRATLEVSGSDMVGADRYQL